MLYTCVFQTCKKPNFTNTEPCVQSKLIFLLEVFKCFTWLHLKSFGMKGFIGKENCFKRHQVTPLGAPLSEIVSQENNRPYSHRLWAQVQTQTIALDQTRALHRNAARFRKKRKKIGYKSRPSIIAESLFEHVLRSLRFFALQASRV